MESDERASKRRKLVANSEQGADAPPELSGRDGLSAFAQSHLQKKLLKRLDLRAVKTLARVNKAWNAIVGEHTPTAFRVTGLRTIGSQHFWSQEPVDADKRYFKPTSIFGATLDVPHVSEQGGFDRHVTDVVSLHFPGTSGFAEGDYPSKAQYPEDTSVPRTPKSYRLGRVDLPTKPSKGRVLTLAPPISREPADTYIETKSVNRAMRPPLPPSYPRTRLTPTQASKSLTDSRAQFEGQTVHKFDKPGT